MVLCDMIYEWGTAPVVWKSHSYLESLGVFPVSSTSTFLFLHSWASCGPAGHLTSVSEPVLLELYYLMDHRSRSDLSVTELSPEGWALSPLVRPQCTVRRLRLDVVDAPAPACSILHDFPLSNPGSLLIHLELGLCASSFPPMYVHHLHTFQQPPKVGVIRPNCEETGAQRGQTMSLGSQSGKWWTQDSNPKLANSKTNLWPLVLSTCLK